MTPTLFARFPDAQAMALAESHELEAIIKSLGFFRAKAKNLKSCAQALVRDHAGEVPKEMAQLTSLAGVGRKTANVVLGNAFNITSGIVVDTHVTRLAGRFNWTQSQGAEKIEADLEKIIPRADWILISHLLIYHGRQTCKARSPQCDACFMFDPCPRRGV